MGKSVDGLPAANVALAAVSDNARALWNPGALPGNVAGEVFISTRLSSRSFRRNGRALVSSVASARFVGVRIGAGACRTRGGLADSAWWVTKNFERARRIPA